MRHCSDRKNGAISLETNFAFCGNPQVTFREFVRLMLQRQRVAPRDAANSLNPEITTMTNRIIDLPVDPDLRSVLRDQIDSLLTTIDTGDSYAMGQLDMAKAVMAMLKNLAVPVVRTKPMDWQAEARKAANDFVRARNPAERAKATSRLNKAHAELAKAKASHDSENAVAVGCATAAAPAVAAAEPAGLPDRLPNCIGRGAGQHNEHCYAMRQWLVAKQAVKA